MYQRKSKSLKTKIDEQTIEISDDEGEGEITLKLKMNWTWQTKKSNKETTLKWEQDQEEYQEDLDDLEIMKLFRRRGM